ncbi:hypothetical protein BU15DRAFT_61589 [Melanogaster broomeanus]|nr:hypothetical protein BU15DRAFT_61589 [Melanogaster broomeanus]
MEPTNKTTTNQPQAAMQMSAMNPAPVNNAQNHQEHHHAKRIRGGGAGKECFMAALECFLCFECCKGCCECCADIIYMHSEWGPSDQGDQIPVKLDSHVVLRKEELELKGW